MRRYALVLPFLLFGSLHADWRVKGAEEFAKGTDLSSAVAAVLAQGISQDEIDLFLTKIDPLVAWSAEHREALFVGVPSGSADRLEHLRQQPVWEEIGLAFEEYMALALKIGFGLSVVNEGKKQLSRKYQQQVELFSGFLADSRLSPEQHEQIILGSKLAQALVSVLANYSDDNFDLIEGHRVALQAALERMETGSQRSDGP